MSHEKSKKLLNDGEFKRVYGPSMGSLVDSPMCSICEMKECEHLHPTPQSAEVLRMRGQYRDVIFMDQVNFIPSFVPAPACSECKIAMEPASNDVWSCNNPSCSLYQKPIHTGIFPFREVRPKAELTGGKP